MKGVENTLSQSESVNRGYNGWMGMESETSARATHSSEQMISLEEYVREMLPMHLQKLLMERIIEAEQTGAAHTSVFAAPTGVAAQYPAMGPPMLPGQTFSSRSFAEGLVVGQLSVIVVLIFFIKFFIFSDGPAKTGGGGGSSAESRSSGFTGSPLTSTTSRLLSTLIKRGGKEGTEFAEDSENERTRQINAILEKTYYDVETHSPESLDWFNVLIAQTIQKFREEALQKDNIVHSLNDFISRKSSQLPNYLDAVKITELDIGDDFPIFSNCRIKYSPPLNKKRLEAKIDIDLSDRLTLGIETRLLMNYPKYLTASLPVKLTVSMLRFQACLTVSLTTAEEFVPTMAATTDTDAGDSEGHYLVFSFSPDYRMEFDIKSLIGARSKLENIPKISSLVEYQIKKWFMDRCVEPRFQFVKLPSMWPRSKNTREEKSDMQEEDPSRAPE
ncbi:AAL166Cp [Eremothecium gossypii ATCC 10895]|uniref:Maintenance of mitochondrial morphology protein 1 n=1 Tax=Eremothecium gossypii (strain ATCC 10895 / CBS 109.51 / FGSC 9923 / NRRL Y-1056) TaxID=284811 RepID=MMM1_EREGS|nr:AAL166Cp [Eremothecium gossypii ATCC 10895]Q75FA5.1 RecName: Full=Maintenance of mitochondrial morphology protein 1 [Eremothecium gossypii ATCC 10895]AAS50200.1 AAL166Cp [Eremothecium gossypii ATCC 10895]AEY94485.1 FAAL166Cp [Eremothecium gossypii FDAG1]